MTNVWLAQTKKNTTDCPTNMEKQKNTLCKTLFTLGPLFFQTILTSLCTLTPYFINLTLHWTIYEANCGMSLAVPHFHNREVFNKVIISYLSNILSHAKGESWPRRIAQIGASNLHIIFLSHGFYIHVERLIQWDNQHINQITLSIQTHQNVKNKCD